MSLDVNSATTEGAAAPAPRKRGFGGYAALVAAGIFLSRVAGLIREAVFARYLGNSWAADAFKFAQKAPNVLQNLFGEGVLSASFIPVYARLVAKGDEDLAGRVAGVFISLLTILVSKVDDEEVSVQTQKVTSLLEPLLIVGMALVVGFIVISVMLPILNISDISNVRRR